MPLLDYKKYRQSQEQIFRFTGNFESITDGHTLWVKGHDLTIPVALEKTKCWFLQPQETGDAPQRLSWNRVSTIPEGVKVYMGGYLKMQDNRLIFISAKDKPLVVIFYDCPDEALTNRIIRSARTRNEYWNNFTSISLTIGAIALIYIAAFFLNRPAYRLTVITALVAIFVPIMPILPPGLLFTFLYRRLTWQARQYRAYWDIIRLPMRFLQPEQEKCTLDNGEEYGYVKIDADQIDKNPLIPWILPEISGKKKKTHVYLFGVRNPLESLPIKSKDPFVDYGLLPDLPKNMEYRYAIIAYIIEFFAWIILLAGIISNVIFIFMILQQLKIVSF